MELLDSWIPEFMSALPEGPVLDLGMGEGALTLELAHRGVPVVGVEVDEARLKRVRERCAEQTARVELRHADIRDVEIAPEHYAGVALCNVVQFLPSPDVEALVRRVQRGLRPGGAVLLTTFSPQHPACREMQLRGVPLLDAPGSFVDESGNVLSFFSIEQLASWFEGWELRVVTSEFIEHQRQQGRRQLHGQSVLLALKPSKVAEPVSAPPLPARVPGPEPRSLPVLGVGLGLRRPYEHLMAQNRHRFDVLEVLIEEHLDPIHQPRLRSFASLAPLVVHGTSLSMGGAAPRPDSHLASIARAVERSGSPWFSDHLSFTTTDVVDTASLIPLPYTEESIEVLTTTMRRLRQHTHKPFLLENVAYFVNAPHSRMSEAEFISRVLERLDAGLLLDVCNVVLNAENHGYDPFAFVDSLPLERVVQLHLAGGVRHDGLAHDTHSAEVERLTWELYTYVLARAPVRCVILERDQDLPALEEVLAEVEHARALFRKQYGEVSLG